MEEPGVTIAAADPGSWLPVREATAGPASSVASAGGGAARLPRSNAKAITKIGLMGHPSFVPFRLAQSRGEAVSGRGKNIQPKRRLSLVRERVTAATAPDRKVRRNGPVA